MATTFKVATFNCENLFARYKFEKGVRVSEISRDGWDINQTRFEDHDPEKRSITGKAIRSLRTDVLVLQEVENMDVLKRFRSKYLGGFRAFPHVALIDGNDPRYIDIAVLSRHPIAHVRTHQNRKLTTRSRSFIFSRDCLEVDVQVGGMTMTLFGNHFKSMMGGRANTRLRRQRQVEAVMAIVKERFGAQAGAHPFIILGDFNDYLQDDTSGKSSIRSLVDWDQVENVVERLPEAERWTHYYKRKKSYTQLDYILVSTALQPFVRKVHIERRGMPKRAIRYPGPHFDGVGENSPKASDHCPVLVEFRI